jgi:DNA-directed RNA polymerase specialized sigma24 family protein
MDELNQELQSLINLACSHPPTSRQHRQALNSLFRSLLQSGRVWQNAHDFYEEALSETMLFVSQELCRRYDANRGTFLVWFNTCLYRKFIDKVRAEQREQQRRPRGELDPSNLVMSGIDATLLLEIWESFAEWLENDLDGVLFPCSVAGNLQANCQVLAKLRVLQGQEWQEISQIIGVQRSTITSHWCRKCMPLMQAWFDKNQRLFGETNHD